MASTIGNIISSIRDQIPDPLTNASDPSSDGRAFTFATLLRWINDAGRLMATAAPVIQDWYAIPSARGMDIYNIPPEINMVEQAWYDLQPLTRTAELDDLFVAKITARSWWFGGHSVHAQPRIHVWPACDRTGSVTSLVNPIGPLDASFTVASTAGIKVYGFLQVDDELILYRNIDGTTGVVTNILRGQGGTTPVLHSQGAPVKECNIFFKCSKLPKPLVTVNDVVEIPQGLWPLLELYVIAKVREAEQEHQVSAELRKEFGTAVEKLGQKAQMTPVKQGLQVRTTPPGPDLYGGRTYIQ